MALLQCEICGGKLKGRPGGIYECEFCGVEYDTAWAKTKIQEIKGTVKVEGTVQVAGAVKIDGPVKIEGGTNAESLLKRAQLALEDGEAEIAKEYFEQVLSMDPNCAEAYFGLAMIQADVDTLEALVNTSDRENRNYRRGKQFAGQALKKQIEGYEKALLVRRKKEETERKQAENARIQQTNARIARLKPLIERSRKASVMICEGQNSTIAVNVHGQVLDTWDELFHKKSAFESDIVAVCEGQGKFTVGLTSDGRVVLSGVSPYDKYYKNVEQWRDIVAIDIGSSHILGLTDGGRVLAAGYSSCGQCDVGDWQNIVAICAAGHITYGLTADGRVITTTLGYERDQIESWRNIVEIHSRGLDVVGLTADGRVLSTNNPDGCNIAGLMSNWRDVVSISGSSLYTAGVTADGRVITTGILRKYEDYGQCDVDDWQNIVAVYAGYTHMIGLTADGRVLTSGKTDYSQNNVGHWKLFNHIDSMEEERNKIFAERDEKKNAAAYQCGCSLMNLTESEKDLMKARSFFEKAKDYRDSSEKIKECDVAVLALQEKKRMSSYQRGCTLLSERSSEKSVMEAKAIFEKLKDYRDSREKFVECDVAIPEARKEEKYRTACGYLKWITVNNLESAKKLFKELEDWRDSKEKALFCEERIKILWRIERLRTKQKKLENERASLGIFSGKRRKEIAAQIESIETEIDRINKEELA